MTANEEETIASGIIQVCARAMVTRYTMPEDLDASTLAVLWAAFQAEAIKNGLSEWRGVELGDN